MNSLWQKLKSIYISSNEVAEECTKVNVRRILFGAPFILLIHATLVVLFILNGEYSDMNSQLWRRLLIIVHGAMFVFVSASFAVALWLKKRGQSRLLARLLQFSVPAVMLACAVAITAIDQLVTTNVTAYILISLALGAALLIHPLYSFIYYASSYVAYYFLIALNAPPMDTLLSNRVNGLASAVLGFLLTFIMWQQNQVRVIQDNRIDEQRQALEDANHRLEKMAFFDSLTGLPNRRYFDQVLQKESSKSSRMGYDSFLIMLDIDLFKNINDMYGHPIGDELLVEIGKLLSGNIRKYDTICRLGGEEFLLLLPETTLEEALVVAEKLRNLLDTHVFSIKDYIIHTTASFGVARLSHTTEPQLASQYTKVDNALYLAKQSGRNCIKSACLTLQ